MLHEDFYQKYEVLTNYQDLISNLKLPKVHFGFRPKLWPEDKLKFTIEEILSYRSELQKKYFKDRKKEGRVKLNIHCVNDVTDFMLEFVKDKYPKSQVTREKFILELLWTLENFKHGCLYFEQFSELLLGNVDH